MKVLLTGSEGYIGAVLRDRLLEHGHEVTGLDTGFFNECNFGAPPRPIPLIACDIRHITPDDLCGFDAVLHLAALSNDPLGNLAPHLTHAINTLGSLRLAEAARKAGVARFLFSSSCSLYGHGAEKGLNEEAEPNPQTPYAKSKIDFERVLATMAGDDFSPVYLRNATAFGVSPRLRLDIVVNNLAGWAWTTGRIAMSSDGTPWRPLVHVDDIARAFVCALEAPREAIHNQAFNVGSSENNVQIRDIARKVQEHMPRCEITFGHSDGDTRTYHVDFTKIETRLPGFGRARWTVDDGVAELLAAYKRLSFDDAAFNSRLYTRLKQIRHLQDTGRIDGDLHWINP